MHGAAASRRGQAIWLTASGGPFRTLPLSDFAQITVEQALATHLVMAAASPSTPPPCQQGLEIIEACRLFDLPPRRVKVTVHPQSPCTPWSNTSTAASWPRSPSRDMRLPFSTRSATRAHASDLTFDLAALAGLHFEQADFARFPCLRLAYEAAEAGGAHHRPECV